jgi:hypothetical protein
MRFQAPAGVRLAARFIQARTMRASASRASAAMALGVTKSNGLENGSTRVVTPKLASAASRPGCARMAAAWPMPARAKAPARLTKYASAPPLTAEPSVCTRLKGGRVRLSWVRGRHRGRNLAPQPTSPIPGAMREHRARTHNHIGSMLVLNLDAQVFMGPGLRFAHPGMGVGWRAARVTFGGAHANTRP